MSLNRFLLLLAFVAGAGFLALRAFGLLAPADATGERAAPEPFVAEMTSGGRQPVGPSPTPQAAPGESLELVAARKNQAAVDLLGDGEYEHAVRLFEECLEAVPDQDVFGRNLAEALARLAQQQHESEDPELRLAAIDTLGRALGYDPSRDGLTRLHERWKTSRDAEEDFWRQITQHFELSFDGTRDELMWGTTPLENELEAAYHEFGELFGFFPVEEGRPRFRVVLYRREKFDAVTGLGDWAGGAFDGTVRVPVEDLGREVDKLKRVLRHELVHAFVHEAGGPRIPGWLNEGIAQWLEPPFLDGRQTNVNRAKAKLAEKPLFDLDRLGGTLATWTDKNEIEVAYAQSLAFVAYLERMYGESVLIEMITGCQRGRLPQDTFRARTGVELSDVLQDLAHGL